MQKQGGEVPVRRSVLPKLKAITPTCRALAVSMLLVASMPVQPGHAGAKIDDSSYTTFIVSPVGVDAATRRYAQPQQALQAAAGYRQNGGDKGVRIVFEQGSYYLDAPLQLPRALSGTQARPTELVAAKGASPRLLAGRALALQWTQGADGVFSAQVPGAAFDRLFVNGVPQQRARYPNYDPAVSTFNGYAADAIAPARSARWKHPAGGVLHALHKGRWGGMHIPILGRNADGSLQLGEAVGNNRPSPPHETYRYVENIREELDAPGEWYLDRDNAVLYLKPMPGVDLTAAKIEAGGAQRILSLQGTQDTPLRHVRVTGLGLSHTGLSFLADTEQLLRSDWSIAREGAVFVQNTEDVTIADNDLVDLGGDAVFVSGYNRRLVVRGNHIHDIGGSAVSLVGLPQAVRSPSFRYEEYVDIGKIDMTPGPKTQDYPADSRVENNLIHHIGQIEKQSAGVQLSMAMDILVAHNTIYQVPRAGINVSEGTWGGHVIEYNDVFDTVLETGDHGAFNSWGRDRFWHPDRKIMDKINADHPGLWKLDAQKPITLRYNRFHCEHGWDVDLDDGSSNYRIHHNVMLSGGLKFREGFDRAAWNNILINNGFHPHVWFANSGDRFERNIVMAAHQPILMEHWDAVSDYNLFPSAQALAQARALGLDQHSAQGDPRFINAARGDYRVGARSPARKLGFENFPMDRFGVTLPRLKRLQDRHAPTPELVVSSAATSEASRELLGATVKTVTTLGEQSAAGLPEIRGVLVLQVAAKSLAEKSGLRPGDVIIGTVADEFSPAESINDAAALFAMYGARRWRGSQAVEVMRNQKPMAIGLRFVEQ